MNGCPRCGGWTCPRCGEWNDGLPAEAGAVTICLSCGQLLTFDGGVVRLPTPQEWTAVRNDGALWQQISYARSTLR